MEVKRKSHMVGKKYHGCIVINTPVPTTANKFFGNGRELQDDFSVDPNYFSTYFREYDPVLGRFNGIDPLAANFDMYSPYHYAYNDPVNFSDPTGAEPEHFEEQMNIYDYYAWMDPTPLWFKASVGYGINTIENGTR